MKKVLHRRKHFLFFAFFLLTFTGSTQVTQQWAQRYNGSGNGNDYATAIAVDAAGNVYVTGTSYDDESYGYWATVKYDANGNQLWVKTYNSPDDGPDKGSNAATAIAVDAAGNVYVTGGSYADLTSFDYATIKYDRNGNQLWVARFDGGNDFPSSISDKATGLILDAAGNVYVTGVTGIEWGDYTRTDYATIKYDTNGNQLWVETYNGPANGSDAATAIALDALGNVCVTGNSAGSGTGTDYATIKYDTNGNQLWVARFDGGSQSSFRDDEATAIAVDASGNVYVTGTSTADQEQEDYATIKYDSNGNQLWVAPYYRSNFDHAKALALDTEGNVYVTGSSWGKGMGLVYATVKYDSNGNKRWVQLYHGPENGGSAPQAIAVDAVGNVYVTGSSENGEDTDEDNNPSTDYATVKYSQGSPLQVDAGRDTLVYFGYGSTCVTLTATASLGTTPYQYSWSPAGGTAASTQVCPTATTTYTVTATDALGQTASDQVTVTVSDVRCGHKDDKVLVCHKGKSLCIASSAVAAHLGHGDQLGNCQPSSALTGIHQSGLAPALAEETADRFRVFAAPNPFNTATTLQYVLPADGIVSIKVYDAAGRQVATLVQAEQKAGIHLARFNAETLTKGMYYYQALFTSQQETLTQTGKLVVTR